MNIHGKMRTLKEYYQTGNIMTEVLKPCKEENMKWVFHVFCLVFPSHNVYWRSWVMSPELYCHRGSIETSEQRFSPAGGRNPSGLLFSQDISSNNSPAPLWCPFKAGRSWPPGVLVLCQRPQAICSVWKLAVGIFLCLGQPAASLLICTSKILSLHDNACFS